MLPRGPEAVEGGQERRGQEALAARGSGRAWMCRAYSRTSSGRMRIPSRQGDEVAFEEALLAAEPAPLLADDGERPQHEDDLGLLLVVAQDDPDRALLDVARVHLHARVLGGQVRLAARPDHGHVDRVDEEDRDHQGGGLEQEAGGGALHVRCPPGRRRRCPPGPSRGARTPRADPCRGAWRAGRRERRRAGAGVLGSGGGGSGPGPAPARHQQGHDEERNSDDMLQAHALASSSYSA